MAPMWCSVGPDFLGRPKTKKLGEQPVFFRIGVVFHVLSANSSRSSSGVDGNVGRPCSDRLVADGGSKFAGSVSTGASQGGIIPLSRRVFGIWGKRQKQESQR